MAKKVKNIMCSPFSVGKWPSVADNVETEILGELRKSLGAGTKKPKDVRSVVTIGMNETTRALERGEVRALLVQANSATSHLIQLCAVRNCRAVALSRLSDTMAEVLAVSRTAVVGVRAAAQSCDQLTELVARHVKPPRLDWLNCQSAVSQPINLGKLTSKKKRRKKKMKT